MNVCLIGMSGVGKSFLGKKLADSLGYSFLDVDILLEKKYEKSVQEILNQLGDERFTYEEGQEILQLQDLTETVIAPGGSIVYSDDAVKHLKSISKVIYLSASGDLIKERTKPEQRGIVGLKGRSFQELYMERIPLYEDIADYSLDIENKDADSIVKELESILQSF
ncbi:MAG: shikimate kinase [Candidatus Paceibacterota bacterium]